MRQKCCFEGCENRGVPERGFGFFVCAECLDGLDKRMEIQFLREIADRELEARA